MTEVDFQRAKLSPEMATFLGIFLRFEFALKERGFCPRSGDALVEWGRVTKELGQAFFTRVSESPEAATILQRPPKKQVSDNYCLDWKVQRPPANIQELFEAVRRVRNNLVHGGKSNPEHDPDDPLRNEKLVREAKWIVEQALLQMTEWPAAGFTDTELRCFDGTGGFKWREGSSAASSSLRR
jgi:hypothetical protein